MRCWTDWKLRRRSTDDLSLQKRGSAGARKVIDSVMAKTQKEKAEAFRALHERDGAFIIPNPWDIGSARLLAAMGFEALATTSAGFAWSIGKLDQQVTRDELVAHVAEL